MDPTGLLLSAARSGDTEQVQHALAAGAQVEAFDDWGLTPLHSAAISGHCQVAHLLLDAGARIGRANKRGQTALHLAATGGQHAVVELLISRRSDVLQHTAHGVTPLDLAQRGSPSEEFLRLELARRLQVYDSELQELQTRLQSAEALKATIKEQLGIEEEVAITEKRAEQMEGLLPAVRAFDAAMDGASQARSIVTNSKTGYWRRSSALLQQIRLSTEASVMKCFLRDPQRETEASDSFPWKGPLISQCPLPRLNPSDDLLAESYERLIMAADEKRRRQAYQSTMSTGQMEFDDEILGMVVDMDIDADTGRSQQAWEELVLQLRSSEGAWDWSKVIVRQLDTRTEGSGVRVAVFAVGESHSTEPVFSTGDVVGPLGGMLLRRAEYEQLQYGGQSSFFHDPQAYILQIRAKSTELKTEQLVLDLGLGESQNRLKYIRDIRRDPLGLGRLIPMLPSEVEDVPPVEESTLQLPERRPRERIRSRPGSPVSTPAVEETPEATEGYGDEDEDEEEGEEDQSSLPQPNVRIVEVQVDGWPYAFVVAISDISHGEELKIDRGEEYWAAQRTALKRLHALGSVAEEILRGVQLPEGEASKSQAPSPKKQVGWKA